MKREAAGSSKTLTLLYKATRRHVPSHLILYREIVAAYCENDTNHPNKHCGQNEMFFSGKAYVNTVTTFLSQFNVKV
jgi:hypothetical protein